MNNKKIIMSAVLLTLLSTGCVKPTEEVNNAAQGDNSNGETVAYTEQPNSVTYEEPSDPIVYSDPTVSTTSNSNVIYGDTITDTTATISNNDVTYGTSTGDGTIIATDHYQPAVGSITTSTSTGSGAYGGGAYGTLPSSGGRDIYNSIDDPYTSTGTDSYSSYNSSHRNSYSQNNPYSSSVNNYHTNNSYSTGSSPRNNSYSGGGSAGSVQLQVAALSSYYSAKEFKNGLSLDPKYSAYIKKGRINKVIIKGFSSRAEAKALAARQFPGAFIVSGSSASSYSSTPSYSGSSSSYSTHNSYSSSSSAHTASGIGIQVGAFSSKTKARSIAQSKAGGKYTAIVKTAQSRGKTIYKAIILGFSSRADAKRAIASGRFGDAFVVSVH